MNLLQALEAVWRESSRSSQSLVAKSIGVPPSALTRWKGGEEPRGVLRAKLFAWAEAQPHMAQELPALKIPSDYWRGVFYAAEAMSETVTRLLRRNYYICPTSAALVRATTLARTDPEAASKFAGQRECAVTKPGRTVLVDELVQFGVRRVHYRGDPTMWYVESDGVAALMSSDADSLRRR